MHHSLTQLKNNPMLLSLHKATFLKRYKRFLVDVEKEGIVTTVHCPNSGSMKGLTKMGNIAWVSLSSNPNRKLIYTLEIIEDGKTCVGVNTHRPNQIIYDALIQKPIPELADYCEIKKEVKIGASRIDFLLTSAHQIPLYLEVKNVTLKEGDYALFPDAPTLRGTKHLMELINIKNQGYHAAMLYVIQRGDCKKFSVAKDIDPLYYSTLEKAIRCGVQILAYQCDVRPSSIKIDKKIPIDLKFTNT